MTAVFLQTGRLVLRKLDETDFDAFYSVAADREMCRMMGRDDLTDIEAARRTFDYLKDCEERGYALLLRENGQFIGNLTVSEPSFFIALRPELNGKKGCSLSFGISREFRRQGLIFEAASSVIDRLFHEEGFDYINCGHFDFNLPSRALQEKLGFRYLCSGRIELDGEEVVCIENILWNPNIQ